MQLLIVGVRRSGTTILFDALRSDPSLRCFYEPLREEDPTEGGGSGARAGDAFAETRELRRRFREQRFPGLPAEQFNWGGPRAPELELEPQLPEHCREWLRSLLGEQADVAIKETRLHHKLAAVHGLAPAAALVHLVRDPRAVTASMLFGRRRRVDLYPDADAFFTARTGRRLWSSRAISEQLADRMRSISLPGDLPDFLRPLLVWKAAFETTHGDGRRLFGERYLLLRLEDLRSDPAGAIDRIYRLAGREPPEAVAAWASEHVRGEASIDHGDDPRWAQAARRIGMEDALAQAGYGGVLDLGPTDAPALDLSPPPPPSRLSAMLGRTRRRLDRR